MSSCINDPTTPWVIRIGDSSTQFCPDGKELILSRDRFTKLREFLLSLETDVDGDSEEDERSHSHYAKHAIDVIYSSYAAAQSRLHQHIQLTSILQREVDEWGQKIRKSAELMPEYKPLANLGPWQGHIKALTLFM